MSGRLGELGYKRNRRTIHNAYQEFCDGVVGSESRFYKIIIDFAKGKISGAIFDLPEQCMNVDDYAQEIAVKVWSRLGDFKGNATSFHSWLNRICFTLKTDAFNSGKKIKDRHVPFFVEVEDEDGIVSLEDNPLLHPPDDLIEHRRQLPEFIQGRDRQICEYIREGYSYGKIAGILSMTEKAVERRVNKMRIKIQEMKNAKSKTA